MKKSINKEEVIEVIFVFLSIGFIFSLLIGLIVAALISPIIGSILGGLIFYRFVKKAYEYRNNKQKIKH